VRGEQITFTVGGVKYTGVDQRDDGRDGHERFVHDEVTATKVR
jgi:hypothetical protein